MSVSVSRHCCLRIVVGFAVGLALACFSLGALAQREPTGPIGSVTGTVFAQDTQAPIRFAEVQLQSVASVNGASSGRRFGGFGGGGSRTGVDGTFTATNLAPGDYYVTASAVGFIPERLLLESALANGADPTQLLAALPLVHIQANQTSTINVTLQRGGALSGKVTWEDGSAAAGLSVSAMLATQTSNQLPAPLSGLSLAGFNQYSQTDDRGIFRISGLPTGSYLLETTIQNRPQFGGQFGGGRFTLSILQAYAPGVFRKSAAKAYSVQAGGERNDVVLSLDLRSLRTIGGHASSSDPGLSVASGNVTLTDTTDRSLSLRGSIDSEGDFTIQDVPPGNYILAISGATTQAMHGYGRGENTPPTLATSFQQFSQTLVVSDTDITDFAAPLTPVPSK